MYNLLKGQFANFTSGVHGTVSSSGIRVYCKRFFFFIISTPVTAAVDFMVTRIGPKWSIGNSNGPTDP